MKILLTGSSGFIGKNLKKALEEKFPSEEIVALKRKGKSSASGLADMCSYVDYSDVTSLLDCNDCKNADYAFHLAGITRGISIMDFYLGNIMPTENLLEALKQKSPNLKRFVHMSSLAAAGPSRDKDHPRTESDEENPIELYGKSKLIAELAVASCENTLPYTILRPAGVYGPGDRDYLGAFKVAELGLSVYVAKEKPTPLIYVGDLVEAMIDAALSDKTISKTYFLRNETVTWHELQQKIYKVMGRNEWGSLSIPLLAQRILGRIGDMVGRVTGETPLACSHKFELSFPDCWGASIENAKKDFGFDPKTCLDDGLRRTYEHYLRTGQL